MKRRTAIGSGLGLMVLCFGAGVLHGRASRTSPTPAQTAQDKVLAGAAVDPSGVVVLSHDRVSAAFRKGALLYDGTPERNFKVNVFHRDQAGEVEIHARDTDIFYIVEGAASFTTGGKISGERQTAPDEVRGSSMDGGVSRRISKGDVVIIPAKVTHWFEHVEEPITYLTVKVQ